MARSSIRFNPTSAVLRYGIAVGSVAVALGFHLLLDSLFVPDTLFLLGFGAALLSTSIGLSAWFGGLGPGLLATALCALVSAYHFLHPQHSFSGLSMEATPLIAFVLEGVFVSSLVMALRLARGRAEQYAQEARRVEERYRAVVEQAAEGILLVDLETKRVIDANVAYQSLLGHSPEEMAYLTLYDLLPSSREDTDSYVRRLAEQEWLTREEGEHRRKDGSLVTVEVSANVLLDGGREVLCMVVRDITKRKRTENELRLLNRELGERERLMHSQARRIVAIQEEERRRVANEVHDGFTQTATAAYRRLQTFAEHRGPLSKEGREELEKAIDLVRRTVEESRSVIGNLRPTTLDDFGLATAIRMQVDELRSEGFEASFEDTLGMERLPHTMETALFRVAQEALSNVRKHSETNRVRSAIGCHDGTVRLEVRDWGRGFRTSDARGSGDSRKAVGLSSMHDRVALFSGSLQIRSEPGIGTSIVAEIPLAAAGEEKDEEDNEG